MLCRAAPREERPRFFVDDADRAVSRRAVRFGDVATLARRDHMYIIIVRRS